MIKKIVQTMGLAPENFADLIPGDKDVDVRERFKAVSRSRRKLSKLRRAVLKSKPLKQTWGDLLPNQFDTLAKSVWMTSASHDVQAKVEKKNGLLSKALSVVKSAAFFPIKHWKLSLLVLLGVAGWYFWPRIVSSAMSVWATRGLAAAKEIEKVSSVVGNLEQAHTLEGIGSGAASLPKGLPAAIPDAASSSGFNVPDPSEILESN